MTLSQAAPALQWFGIPIKARLLSETLLLHHFSVNRNVRLQAVADLSWLQPTR